MVIHLAITLDVPLRDRNAWLTSAGFAPLYTERNLAEPALDQVRGVLDHILSAHDPFPAYVVDRRWDLMMTNQSAMALTALVVDPEDAAIFGGNVARLSLHPNGLRRHLVNWNQFGAALLHRLEREVADRPADTELDALLAEVRSYPGITELPARPDLPTSQDLLVPLHLRTPDHDLRLFTTIATIGAPYDITLEELRLETLLPADPETEAALRQLTVDR